MTMLPSFPGPRVVVGYDGSPGSRAALDRAADVAGGDGVVFVVHAYPHPRGWFGAWDDEDRLASVLEAADARMRALCDDAGGPLSRVAWEPEIIAGDPAEAIAAVAAARQADEIVVGSRRLGTVRALLGSVAQDLIRIAGVPVTVIPRGVAPRAEAA
jgi:nucleotide-binding universal stress UspA family protein